MTDQATHLRNLILQARREAIRDHGPPPRMLIVSGGKAGVGVTIVSIHLAIALANQGTRVVLVDANAYHADVATLCGLDDRTSIADVLASRCGIHEVLQPGPCGIQVAPGTSASSRPVDFSPRAQQRLLQQLRSLGRHADLVLIDAGSGGSQIVRRFWQAADDVLLLTTPDAMSVMNCYAAVKRLEPDGEWPSVRLLVNRAPSREVSEEVHGRIDGACLRFLGFHLELAGTVPNSPDLHRPADGGGSSLSPSASRALDRVAELLLAPSRQVTKCHNSVRRGAPRTPQETAADGPKQRIFAQPRPGSVPIAEEANSSLVEVNLQRLNRV